MAHGTRPRHTATVILVALCSLAVVVRADKAYASVTTGDGTMYTFYRTDKTITADQATAVCAAAGATLASLASPEQVHATLWSNQVVAAASEQPDPALLWTGFRISWPDNGRRRNRRMLRATSSSAASPAFGFLLEDTDATLARLLRELDANPAAVPATTPDGRAIPQLVRAHLLDQEQRRFRRRSHSHRALLSSADGGTAATSAFLVNAVVSWQDGSSTDMVLSNTANIGFLACNRKKMAECCGAVFDIGPDAYPGAKFPAIFMYPCNATKFAGSAMAPAGYACAAAPQVGALPDPTARPSPSTKSPSQSPSPPPSSAGKACKPGMMPVTSAGHTQCKKCKRNTYSADGLTCKKCPKGTQSVQGASKCT